MGLRLEVRLNYSHANVFLFGAAKIISKNFEEWCLIHNCSIAEQESVEDLVLIWIGFLMGIDNIPVNMHITMGKNWCKRATVVNGLWDHVGQLVIAWFKK